MALRDLDAWRHVHIGRGTPLPMAGDSPAIAPRHDCVDALRIWPTASASRQAMDRPREARSSPKPAVLVPARRPHHAGRELPARLLDITTLVTYLGENTRQVPLVAERRHPRADIIRVDMVEGGSTPRSSAGTCPLMSAGPSFERAVRR